MQTRALFIATVVDPGKLLRLYDPIAVVVCKLDGAGMPDLFAPIPQNRSSGAAVPSRKLRTDALGIERILELAGIMLDFQELGNQLSACARGRVSIEDFEEWFDENSWNVHQQPNQRLIDVVFEIESLFSAHQGGRLNRQSLLHSLQEAMIGPFAWCGSEYAIVLSSEPRTGGLFESGDGLQCRVDDRSYMRRAQDITLWFSASATPSVGPPDPMPIFLSGVSQPASIRA